MAKVTMIEAINRAHAWEMAHDSTVVVLGEDIGINGGVFRATAGLQERFGKERVQDTPLAEGMIAGMSIGLAAQGLDEAVRGVVEVRDGVGEHGGAHQVGRHGRVVAFEGIPSNAARLRRNGPVTVGTSAL